MTERDPSPVRQVTLAALLLVVIVAAGIALGRHLYQGMPPEASQPDAAPTTPAAAGQAGDRLFCATSPDTGRCSCITPEGQRPDIPRAECLRRARQADTTGER